MAVLDEYMALTKLMLGAMFVLLVIVFLMLLANNFKQRKVIDLLEEQNELLWDVIEGGDEE